MVTGVGLVALSDVGWLRDVQTALFILVWVLVFLLSWAMARLGGSPRDAGPATGKSVPPGSEINSRAMSSELGKGKTCPQARKANPQTAGEARHALALAR